MRFLIDMNLTPRWVDALASAGHQAVHWSAVGPFGEDDAKICEYARRNAFVLVTNDLDFPRILAHTLSAKPSVILLRGEPLVPEVRGAVLFRAINDCANDLEVGAVLTIDWSDRLRTRLLPLA